MGRPEFPTGIVLPVGAIRRIRERQAAYDRDPEGYERREREATERRAEEERQERDALQHALRQQRERLPWERR